MNLYLNLTSYRKVNSQWNINLNVKQKTRKHVEENIQEKICQLCQASSWIDTIGVTINLIG